MTPKSAVVEDSGSITKKTDADLATSALVKRPQRSSEEAIAAESSGESLYSGPLSNLRQQIRQIDARVRNPFFQIVLLGFLAMFCPALYSAIPSVKAHKPSVLITLTTVRSVSAFLSLFLFKPIGTEGMFVIGYVGFLIYWIMDLMPMRWVILDIIVSAFFGFSIACFDVPALACMLTYSGVRHKARFCAIYLALKDLGSVLLGLMNIYHYMDYQPYDPKADITPQVIPFLATSLAVTLLVTTMWRPAWSFHNSSGNKMFFAVPRDWVRLTEECKAILYDGCIWFIPLWIFMDHFDAARIEYMCRYFTTLRASALNEAVYFFARVVGAVAIAIYIERMEMPMKGRMKCMLTVIFILGLVSLLVGGVITNTLCRGRVDIYLGGSDIAVWADFPHQVVNQDDYLIRDLPGCQFLLMRDVRISGSRILCTAPGYFGRCQLDWLKRYNTEYDNGSLLVNWEQSYIYLLMSILAGGLASGTYRLVTYWLVAVISQSHTHRMITLVGLVHTFESIGMLMEVMLHLVPGLLFRQMNYLSVVFIVALYCFAILGVEACNSGRWRALSSLGDRASTSDGSTVVNRNDDWISSYEYVYEYEDFDDNMQAQVKYRAEVEI